VKIFDKLFKSVEMPSEGDEKKLPEKASAALKKTSKVAQDKVDSGRTPVPSKVAGKASSSSLLNKITAPFSDIIQQLKPKKGELKAKDSKTPSSPTPIQQTPEQKEAPQLQPASPAMPQMPKMFFTPEKINRDLLACFRDSRANFAQECKEYKPEQVRQAVRYILTTLRNEGKKLDVGALQRIPEKWIKELAGDQESKRILVDLAMIVLGKSLIEANLDEIAHFPKEVQESLSRQQTIEKREAALAKIELNPKELQTLPGEVRDEEFYKSASSRAKAKSDSHYINFFDAIPAADREKYSFDQPPTIEDQVTIAFENDVLPPFVVEKMFFERSDFLKTMLNFAQENQSQGNVTIDLKDLPITQGSQQQVIDLLLIGIRNPQYIAEFLKNNPDPTLLKDLLMMADYFQAPVVFSLVNKDLIIKLLDIAEQAKLPKPFCANIIANHTLTPEFIKDEKMMGKYAQYVQTMGKGVIWTTDDMDCLKKVLDQCKQLKELVLSSSSAFILSFPLPSTLEKLVVYGEETVVRPSALRGRTTPLTVEVDSRELLSSRDTSFPYVTVIENKEISKRFK
jgi:hypothetical protein